MLRTHKTLRANWMLQNYFVILREVIFGASVTAVTQDEHNASITVETSAGQQTHRARFVIGADGARSLVRKAMDLPFEGETYPETTLLVTTLFPFEEHLEGLSNVTYCWKCDGNFSLLKVPGRWRVSPDSTDRSNTARSPSGCRRICQWGQTSPRATRSPVTP